MEYLTCFYAGAAVNWFGIKVNQFTAAHSWGSDPGLQQAVDVGGYSEKYQVLALKKTVILLFAHFVMLASLAQSNSSNSYKQRDTAFWVTNLNDLRSALYMKDKAKARNFADFPISPDENDIWYLACGLDEELFNTRRDSEFSSKDFEIYFNRLFSKQFILCFLKIKMQDLYSRGKSQSPEIKEGRNTFRLYATYKQETSQLELNFSRNIPVRVSNSVYDPGESNIIYRFRVTEKGHVKLLKILLAG
jgi:hypothetical protein